MRRELETEREQLRITLASIGDAVISTDDEGRIVFLNPVAETLTGWPQAEAAGKPLNEVLRIINETTREPVENPAMRALRERRVVDLANHTVLLARDGSERPIDDSAAPMLSQDGTPLGAVLVFRDVSERKRAEAATARLAAIVKSSDDAILSKTLDGVIRSWNAAAERVFGYTAAEAIGQNVTMLIPAERLHEEAAILKQLQQGQRIEHFETVRLAKGGRHLDISLSVSPVKDKNGRVTGASKIARDITERKRADRILRQSEDRLALAVAAANLGDWSWDAATDTMAFSARAMEIFDIPPGQAMTRSAMQALVHEEDRAPALAQVASSTRAAASTRSNIGWLARMASRFGSRHRVELNTGRMAQSPAFSASFAISRSENAWRASCDSGPASWRRATAGRTNSSPCSRTSCAILWHRCALACRCSNLAGPTPRR